MSQIAHAAQPRPDHFEIVETSERLGEIAAEWNALWRRADARIFQSHDWVAGWWNNRPDGDRHQLRLALAWRENELVAVLPLAVSRRAGLRLLEWAAREHTDYCDALVAPGEPEGLLGALWAHVCTAGGFDLVLLSRILPGAHARSLLHHVKGGVKLSLNRRSEQSLRVTGPFTTGGDWFEAQSKKTRQNYRRGVKFLGDDAALRFRLLPPETDLAPVLRRLAELKRLWLTRNGIDAPLFDEGATTLAALVRALADRGQLRIFTLERDGEIAAISVNFVQNGVMMAFVTTYDPAVERGSPGMVLMVDYIKWAIDEGFGTIDFLCGAEGFKSRFASEAVTLESLAGARSPLGMIAMITDEARHWVRARLDARKAPAAVEPGE